MIKFLELTLRNFLSYGNNTTKLKLDFSKPTLIVGKNYDSVVNGQIDSNGSGKSAILNAISFCLYDKTISDIDKSEVVNYINDKNMEVSVVFENNGIFYKVERYRKNKGKGGDGVRIFINEKANSFNSTHDKTPDSVSNANAKIAEILGIPFEIFSRIVVFSATFEPFLSLPSSHASKANQRDIIEELFGLTELTVKAEKLKTEISSTKAALNTLVTKNDRISAERNRYSEQLSSTVAKRDAWDTNQKAIIKDTKARLKSLSVINFDEIEAVLNDIQDAKTQLNNKKNEVVLLKKDLSSITENNRSFNDWKVSNAAKIEKLEDDLYRLSEIDVDHYIKIKNEITTLSAELNECENERKPLVKDRENLDALIKKLEEEVEHLSGSKCPYCNQTFVEAKDKLSEIKEQLYNAKDKLNSVNGQITRLTNKRIQILDSLTPLQKIDMVDTDDLSASIIRKKSELETISTQVNPFTIKDSMATEGQIMDVMAEIESLDLLVTEKEKGLLSFPYEQFDINGWSKETLQKLSNEIDKLCDKMEDQKSATNPFDSIVDEITNTINTKLELPDTDKADKLSILLDHQEFLLKLLTKKDSFVRKALLNKNIPFLNTRLAHYLEVIGMTHKVVFNEEMGVNISSFGTKWSFSNLSTGQKARVNLALSFAFRDVLQARFSKINFCILDECLDYGLGNVGVQLAAKMVKNIAVSEGLSMFVISHKDEISNMFDSKLEVELREGFTNIVKSDIASTVE